MPTIAPSWLSTSAKRYYTSIISELGPLTKQQKDLVALLADQWESYQSAHRELTAYAKTNGTLTVTGSQGQIVPHPMIAFQRAALSDFLRLSRELRLSGIGGDGVLPTEPTDLDNFFDNEGEI